MSWSGNCKTTELSFSESWMGVLLDLRHRSTYNGRPLSVLWVLMSVSDTWLTHSTNTNRIPAKCWSTSLGDPGSALKEVIVGIWTLSVSLSLTHTHTEGEREREWQLYKYPWFIDEGVLILWEGTWLTQVTQLVKEEVGEEARLW